MDKISINGKSGESITGRQAVGQKLHQHKREVLLHLAHALTCASCSNLPLQPGEYKHTRTGSEDNERLSGRYSAEYMDAAMTVILRAGSHQYLFNLPTYWISTRLHGIILCKFC